MTRCSPAEAPLDTQTDALNVLQDSPHTELWMEAELAVDSRVRALGGCFGVERPPGYGDVPIQRDFAQMGYGRAQFFLNYFQYFK